MSTIVTRAGKGSPLTNTEVDSNFTNLNTDKAELSGAAFTGAITTNSTVDGVDIATRDAILTSTTTTANAALPKAGGAMSGAITTSSTFDGRNVSVDGTKLDGIEASATADQTGAQIKTAYEAETNAFTDAQFTKLGGIEASADVTDATNVTAAGALMDSELTSIASVKALNQGVASTDSPTFAALTSTGEIAANGGIALGDNVKAKFGAGGDLEIYHDGTDSFISDQGTGNIKILANDFRLANAANNQLLIAADQGGSATLYNAGGAKLATTSTGIDVTGTVVADGLTVDSGSGNSQLYILAPDTTSRSQLIFGDSADTNVGSVQYDHSDDSMQFHGNNTGERMRIDSSGNVGIGTSSLTSLASGRTVLEVNGSSASALINMSVNGTRQGYIFTDTTDMNIYNVDNGSQVFGTNNTERMRIDSAGNLLVGTTATDTAAVGFRYRSSLNAISSVADGGVAAYFGRRSSDGDIVTFRKDDATVGSIGVVGGSIILGRGDTALALNDVLDAVYPIEADGTPRDAAIDLGRSGTSGRFKNLYLSGNANCERVITTHNGDWGIEMYGTGGYRLRFHTSAGGSGQVGSVTAGTSSTNYNTSSDYRLKTDVQPMTGATATFKQLKPVNFEWIADGTRVDGFLAHELQEVIPAAVTGSKDAMRDEEYEVTAAVYEDVTTPAVDAVDAVLDEDGTIVTEAVEAVEATTESVLVSEAVTDTRSVPDYQGIDQSKLVPLLVSALQEAIARIEALEAV